MNEGKDLAEVLRHLEITDSTWNRWKATCGAMKPAAVKRLKELGVENVRLEKLLAAAELEKAMVEDLAEGTW